MPRPCPSSASRRAPPSSGASPRRSPMRRRCSATGCSFPTRRDCRSWPSSIGWAASRWSTAPFARRRGAASRSSTRRSTCSVRRRSASLRPRRRADIRRSLPIGWASSASAPSSPPACRRTWRPGWRWAGEETPTPSPADRGSAWSSRGARRGTRWPPRCASSGRWRGSRSAGPGCPPSTRRAGRCGAPSGSVAATTGWPWCEGCRKSTSTRTWSCSSRRRRSASDRFRRSANSGWRPTRRRPGAAPSRGASHASMRGWCGWRRWGSRGGCPPAPRSPRRASGAGPIRNGARSSRSSSLRR